MSNQLKRVFITVKAYPENSKKYGACVCTAGITESGEFIRLYPMPLNKFTENSGLRKYTWISIECEKASEYLMRKESYKIKHENIQILSHVDTGPSRDWKERNEIILPMVSKSLEELEMMKDLDSTSLGIIKPKHIERLSIDEVEDLTGDEKEINKEIQMTLFGEKIINIEKIPFIFRYHFKCEDLNCKGHKIMCEDWEMIESWRQWKRNYRDENTLREKFIEKYYSYMSGRDLHFFVGTHSKYNTWLIIGLYYPPQL